MTMEIRLISLQASQTLYINGYLNLHQHGSS